MEIKEYMDGKIYICFNGVYSSYFMSRFLNMEHEHFQELLIKYNATIDIHNIFYFTDYQSAQSFISSDEILPQVIMYELTK